MQPSIPHTRTTIPTPLAALALGIASLGWSWDSNILLQGTVQVVAAAFAVLLLTLVFGKFIRAPRILWQELAHPLLGSVLPTAAMALLVISTVFPHTLRVSLWLLALLLHVALLLGFIWHRRRGCPLTEVLPGWFVPPVGIITAVLTAPDALSYSLAELIFWFGTLCYALLLPVVLYRFVFAGKVAAAAKPNIAVLAAPASLCLATYLSYHQSPNAVVVWVLLLLALLMTSIIYLAMLYLLRATFSVGFSAFTFPLVIGATALFKASEQFLLWQQPQLAAWLRQLAIVELLIASAVTLYVTALFVAHLWPQYRVTKKGLKPNTSGQG